MYMYVSVCCLYSCCVHTTTCDTYVCTLSVYIGTLIMLPLRLYTANPLVGVYWFPKGPGIRYHCSTYKDLEVGV